MRRLIQFFRRLPRLLDSINELEEVRDVWRYAVDVNENRRLVQQANETFFRAERARREAHDLMEKMERPIRELIKIKELRPGQRIASLLPIPAARFGDDFKTLVTEPAPCRISEVEEIVVGLKCTRVVFDGVPREQVAELIVNGLAKQILKKLYL